VLVAAMAVVFGTRVSAHRLDEFLQAARIGLARDRVQLEMNLAPGIAVADGLIREIDVDRNGRLSQGEQQAYAGRVLGALELRVDDSAPLQMQTAASTFPEVAALRAGSGAITIRSEAIVSELPAGPHRLVFHNNNAAAESAYLANALVPEDDSVAVTGQERTGDQRELTILFVVRAASASRRPWVWIGLAGGFVLALSQTHRVRSQV